MFEEQDVAGRVSSGKGMLGHMLSSDLFLKDFKFIIYLFIGLQ